LRNHVEVPIQDHHHHKFLHPLLSIDLKFKKAKQK
jgi:hypothetical protein